MGGMEIAHANLRVLAKPAFSNEPVNPYNARIYRGMKDKGIRVEEFSLKSSMRRHYDVVHFHWPETPFNHNLMGAFVNSVRIFGAMAFVRRSGGRIVWTMHNLKAHDSVNPWLEEQFWRRFLAQVDGVIALTRYSLEVAREVRPQICLIPNYVVAHPHYRGVYPDTISREEARVKLGIKPGVKLLTFFGQVREYKNIPKLIQLVRSMVGVELLVAGKPINDRMRREVIAAAHNDPRIHLRLEHIPDDEVQDCFRACDVVALPYRDILNSGTALLGLSFDRPVWLPIEKNAMPLGEEIRQNTGPGWIINADFDPEGVQIAMEEAEELPERTDGEHLAFYEPARLVDEHLAVYEKVIKAAPCELRY